MFRSQYIPICIRRKENRVVPDAFVLFEALDVLANVPDDELAVGAAADEDGRLERMPQKRLGKSESHIIILHIFSARKK